MHPTYQELNPLDLQARRPLGIALAHAMTVCKPGVDQARLAVLNRLFSGSNSRVRIMCRVELEAQNMERRQQLDAAAALRRRLP